MQNKYELKNLIDKAGTYLPPGAMELINQAHAMVARSYPEDLEHVTFTAAAVAELQLDERCILAALLHKLPQHEKANLAEISEKYGADVFKLVDGLFKLEKVSWSKDSLGKKSVAEAGTYAESLRKMLMAMTDDLRVVFIKMACRLHEVSILKPRADLEKDPKALAEADAIATETLEVYAPIAHRLGMWEIKSQMEEIAFSYTEPVEYQKIAEKINSNRREREAQIAFATVMLKGELEKAGIKAEVTGRIKPVYSYKKKMEKYAKQSKGADQIYDLLGLRILVNEVKDCYSALGVIHGNPNWHPIPDEFNDYIANPRGGTYQSLHTTVTLYPDIPPFEIQIRTYEMHRVAEYGMAAHSRYKSTTKLDEEFEKRLSGLRFLLDQFKDIGGRDFIESIKVDIMGDTVMVYTPKGQVKDLPAGATPLDFAYRVHTDLGHRCTGAKINGRMVPLTYQLKTGDTVEIITSKGDKGPSRDWLNQDLGYLHTSHAKEKVRQWFRKQERSENITRGKEILDKELRRLGISITEDELTVLFKKESKEEFLAAIGYGDISIHQIANRLAVPEEKTIPQVTPKKQEAASGIQVMGVDNLLTQIATCCNPMPGDDIIGYVTRSRGISVHRKDCPNIVNTSEKERLINVGWGSGGQLYAVPVRIEGFDRVGLLRDITGIVAEDGINITSANVTERDDGTSVMIITLQTKGLEQLSRLLSKIEGVQGVINVARLT